ncbi:MAG TPA: 4Fe-4S binding protein [Candidatus Nitrosopelagicus sp.]|nr:ferredoxin [Nitrosopumilales archaeon]MDP7285433.1 4Fe-4S binding protein [Candidatus Nitrosopelagicus sp.]HJN20284.1 4Fe-4S binding protein [Candidatus Nitrosopelagicus sp.]
MSLLLKDRVYTMQSPTAKRGVYPLHGYKLGLYRMPIKLEDPAEIQSIFQGLKNTFEMDMYADRIYATYNWIEENMPDPDAKGYEQVKLSVTVEIVTGEVVDIIYQIFSIEKFGDPQWVKDYRKKADHFAKMVIDTILRNTILSDKMVESLTSLEKISENQALIKLEELTPLAQIVPDAKPIAKIEKPKPAVAGKKQVIVRDGEEAIPGPIDIEYKDKMDQSTPFKTSTGNMVQTWGRVGADNKVMGVWGEFCSVDFDICVADGACIDACPVGVYDFFEFSGNVASTKKPLQINEPDCIFCLACEGVCPPQAIKIYPQ